MNEVDGVFSPAARIMFYYWLWTKRFARVITGMTTSVGGVYFTRSISYHRAQIHKLNPRATPPGNLPMSLTHASPFDVHEHDTL